MKNHPQLSAKFALLYSLCINPSIKSNADLAKRLGLSRQSISKWIHGTETRTGDRIPNTQIHNVSVEFGIEPRWFTLDLEEFEVKLKQKLQLQSSEKYSRPEKISVSLLPITSLKVIGRQDELELFDRAWKDSKINILQVIAFGGVGKSTTINSWLSHLDKNNYFGAKRVYAWSFYWQGSSAEMKPSGDLFIEHALEWFGDKKPTVGTPWAKAARLAEMIRSSKTLLILDGLEPLQYPPGPRHGLVENPAVALLIRELAADNNGLCVISSRIAVSDFATFEDGRVQTVGLSHLTIEASVAMLKSMGITGENSEFIRAANEYSGHPLCLSLLGGYLSVVYGGDIGRYRELKSLVNEQDFGAHAKNLVNAYLQWFKNSRERAILYMLGLFDRAVSLEDIKFLSKKESIKNLTQDLVDLTTVEWGYAIKLLSDANLISIDRKDRKTMIDCHPLVRDFLSGFLESEENELWLRGNSLLFQFLQDTAVVNPVTMAELEPLFRAVIHGTRAGMYRQAFQLYFERIKKGFPMLTEGSHHADQACIRAFFEKEWVKPVDDLSDDAKFHLMSSASTNLMSLGELEEAIEPSLASIDWFISQQKWLEATNAAGPLASMLIAAGRLEKTIALMHDLEDSVKYTNSDVITAIGLNFQAYVYYLSGNNDQAKHLFEQAEEILTQSKPGSPVTFPTISSYYCKFLLDTGEHEKALQRSQKTFSWREKKTWQVAIDTTSLYASDLLVHGLIYLEMGDWENAEKYLNKQVELFKSADEWLYMPAGLNARAKFYIETSRFSEAERDLNEAYTIAERTGAKFGLWETCLYFSQLYLKQNNYSESKKYFKRAKELAGMEFYRFRDSEIAKLEDSLSITDEPQN